MFKRIVKLFVQNREPVYCVQCAFYEEARGWTPAQCTAERHTSLVTGELRIAKFDCTINRRKHGSCGKDAKLFKPKHNAVTVDVRST